MGICKRLQSNSLSVIGRRNVHHFLCLLAACLGLKAVLGGLLAPEPRVFSQSVRAEANQSGWRGLFRARA
jgi:hypothetical protein